MKKVLIISSSPVQGGNSDTLCNEFFRGARESGHSVEKIFLRDRRIHFCSGCMICQTTGLPCRLKDDAIDIISEMLRSDVIILATPVYFNSMSAQLKTLVDRCRSAVTKLREKEFVFIVTGESSDKGKLYDTVTAMTGFVNSLHSSRLKGVVYAPGVKFAGDVTGKPAMKEAYEMGLRI